MRKVIGVGETILDIIFRNNQPHAAVPGGSAFNGLVSLGRMGVPVAFISEVGNDPVGEMILQFMEENNISTDYVDRFHTGKSPVSLAFLDEENNANYVFYRDYPEQRLDVAFPDIREDDIFVFGSYYALNPKLRDRMMELLQYAQERKAIIYYDLNFRQSHAHEAIYLKPAMIENLEFADIVRGSEEDFQHLVKDTPREQVYNEHIRFYCRSFIMTRGAEGVDLYGRDFQSHYPSIPVEPVSTIGAGDSFNAGLIYGLLKCDVRRRDLETLDEATWQKVIRYGLEFSAEVCCSYDNYVSKAFVEKMQPV